MSIAIGMMVGLVLYALGFDIVGIALMAANAVIIVLISAVDWKGTKDEWKRMHGRDD